MNQLADPVIIRASVASDGTLLSADPPILTLQREAGGDLNAPLAVPQLAAIARLVGRLGVAVSRPVTAASADRDIDMWVRANPADDHVMLNIIEWHERSPLSNPSEASAREADLTETGEGWVWQVDMQMRFQLALGSDEKSAALPQVAPQAGSRFTSYFQLLPDEDGDMAILRAFTQRQPFAGQAAQLAHDSSCSFILSGVPIFDMTGRLMGYRGKAARVLPDMTSSMPAVEAASVYPAEFGKRLDRSLRQPLGRIIANADTISAQLEGPLRPDYARYATDIASAGRHLMALVDDLADLQAVDRPDFAVAREEVDLADVAYRAAGLLSVKALDKSIRIASPEMDGSMMAIGEFRRILQILVNLIGNAVRYSPDGSQVWVRTDRSADKVLVIVADQGPGIDISSQEKIFDKFERLGRDDSGGSGLGLYISRRLARAMGGDVAVESAPGQGARFILSLPAMD